MIYKIFVITGFLGFRRIYSMDKKNPRIAVS